jgi:hypothetical protein
MKFKFTGTVTTVFPGLSAKDGTTLVCEPGDIVDLEFDPGHADLAPSRVTTKTEKE